MITELLKTLTEVEEILVLSIDKQEISFPIAFGPT